MSICGELYEVSLLKPRYRWWRSVLRHTPWVAQEMERISTTGSGASGEIPRTVPHRYSSNIMSPTTIMLDEYLRGTVRGISPEAPVPVVEIRSKTYALGGAGNVAANLANLGSNIYLAGVVGNDVEATRLSDLVSATPRISLHAYACQNRPT